MTLSKKRVKRYSLVLPEAVFDEIQRVADEQQTTVVEIIRKFIKLGLIATEIEKDSSAALIIREGDKEKEILLI